MHNIYLQPTYLQEKKRKSKVNPLLRSIRTSNLISIARISRVGDRLAAELYNCELVLVEFPILRAEAASSSKFSDALVVVSAARVLVNDLLRNCSFKPFGFIRPSNSHLLGFICPNNFICSLLNFLFAYHLPPRQPKA